MAFILSDPQVRLNFSRTAEEVIQNDMFIFNESRRSSFINTILENYYRDAESSISFRLNEYKDNISSILPHTADEKEYNRIVKALLNSYRDELMHKSEQLYNLPKSTVNNPHRLRQEFYSYLTDDGESCDDKFYPSPAKYLRALIEEYVRLPFCMREKQYFKPYFEEIEYAIEHRKQLKVKTANGLAFHTMPYAVMQDPLSSMNYLVGYSYPFDSDKNEKRPGTFRISTVSDIRTEHSLSGIIHEADKKKLIDAISAHGVQFLSTENTNVVVRLTPKGIEDFNKIINLRPTPVKIEDDIYTFNCSPMQANFYFLKFCENAEILEPASLREEFASHYSKACEIYK